MTDRYDPFTGRRIEPEQARDHSIEKQPGEPRLGVPADKFGAFAIPFLQPDKRAAVMLLVIPPEQLRDADYETVERAVFAHGAAYLKTLAREIHQAWTTDLTANTVALENAMNVLRGPRGDLK